MSLSDLAALGSFISGVAVLVSLIFIGFQMRQNTLAIKAAASQAHAANFQQILTSIIENSEVARIWRVGLSNMQRLTDDERVRFVVLVSGNFRFFESARLQWRSGQLDVAHWEDLEPFIRQFALQPGIRTYWTMRRHMHSSEFISWYDSLPQSRPARGLYELPSDIEQRTEAFDTEH
jgi:hypothetical protein